jgi:enoyl-CoA hydratase/carnithine racemase
MEEAITELSSNVLRVQLNRPAKKNAMTLARYVSLAEDLERAAKKDDVRVMLVLEAADSFTAGNDIADFASHPPGPDSPQARFLDALIRYGKPLVAAAQDSIRQAVSCELSEFAPRVRSAEAKEAFAAFLEKRKPDYSKAKAS